MAGISLSLVVVRSADLERAATFYRALGLILVKERHGKGPEHYACAIDKTVFELYPYSKDQGVCSSTRLGFCVPCLEATLAALDNIGAEIMAGAKNTSWGRTAVVRDPDGRSVEITQGPKVVLEDMARPPSDAP